MNDEVGVANERGCAGEGGEVEVDVAGSVLAVDDMRVVVWRVGWDVLVVVIGRFHLAMLAPEISCGAVLRCALTTRCAARI